MKFFKMEKWGKISFSIAVICSIFSIIIVAYVVKISKYCSFTLISYQWENQFLLAIIINLLILVIVFCLTGKKYMNYKILFIVLGGVLGFFYFV